MRRLSLFWKMYLGFLVMLFLPMALVELSFAILRSRPEGVAPPGLQKLVTWSAASLAVEIGRIAGDGPSSMLSTCLERAGNASGIDFYLLSSRDSGDLVLPSPLPEEIGHALARRAGDRTAPRTRQDFVLAVAPFLWGGASSRIVAAFSPFRHEAFPLRHVGMFVLPMAIGAALCFVLVRHIVGPILELRRRTTSLASGNFGARVGTGVLRRGDEIADLGVAFNGMAERIETLVTSQKRLLGDISHELRSPLQRLDVALTLARGGKDGASQDAFLDRVGREAGRIGAMVDQLLALTAVDVVLPRAEEDRVSVAVLLERIAEDVRFEGRGEGKGVSLALDSPDLTLIGDENLLSSAVENVVRNALRYTAPGTSVELVVREDRGDVVLTVRDFGPGVEEKELPRIFQPFYRVDPTRDRRSGGVGLGLAIAQRVLLRHGGTIRARNASPGLAIDMVFPGRGVLGERAGRTSGPRG